MGDRQRERLAEQRGPVTIVVFGDSIWDISRDETGIAARLSDELGNARIYNCAMMGTTAAYREQAEGESPEDTADWNRKSLMGILTMPEGMETVAAETGAAGVPVQEADYIVLAYGLNDYFCAIPREGSDSEDVNTYGGALRRAVALLREKNPRAVILLLSQTYCQGYSYGKVDSESDYKDYGGGTGPEYVETARRAAEETGCVFVDNYKEMGINLRNGPKYLSDATHLTEYGRKRYARVLASHLLEEYKKWFQP